MCGHGAAYMLTPESSFDDFGVVRLIHWAAYILKITVILKKSILTWCHRIFL